MELTTKQQKIFRYLKTDIKNISKPEFIKFLFPESLLIPQGEDVPCFFDDSVPMFLVTSSKERLMMDMIPNLVILNKNIKNGIDNRKGFLVILTDVLKFKISEKLTKELNNLNDEDFWITVKTWYSLGQVWAIETAESNSMTFGLFKSLFGSYGILYESYVSAKEPHSKVVSSLVTMMTKAKNLESQINISQGYRKVLENHQRFLPVFERAIFRYAKSSVTEVDFLRFLYECSSEYIKRHK